MRAPTRHPRRSGDGSIGRLCIATSLIFFVLEQVEIESQVPGSGTIARENPTYAENFAPGHTVRQWKSSVPEGGS
jgi:hypothetical protein